MYLPRDVVLQMKELAIYMLLVQGGNAAPSAADVKKAAEAVGITVDEDSLSNVIANVAGKVCVARLMMHRGWC